MVIDVSKFDYKIIDDLKIQKRGKGVKSKKRYLDVVTAFDIETTNIDEIRNSIMYIWQFQIMNITVIGRRWEDFKTFMHTIEKHMQECTMVVYVHNLSFEFQWLKSVLPIDDLFAMDNRKILKFTSGKFEFRCSYLHSNMSLAKYVEKCGAEFQKIKGFDYSKKRYPWTPLTEQELLYCINDVRALTSALINEMKKDGDNLYTIPLTITGYTRRRFKEALIPYKEIIKEMLPDLDVFQGLRGAFRGGNTHANRNNANRLLKDVTSYDISSSYPAVMITEKFPCKFVEKKPSKFEQSLNHGKACLIYVYLENVKLIDDAFGCPYLPKAKCEYVINGEYDNGRILACDSCYTWITEIDFTILVKEYSFNYSILKLYTANKKLLPLPFRKLLFEMYVKKTELKGVDDYTYSKYKSMVNSTFGMTVQNPCKPSYKFENGEVVVNFDESMADLINDYHKMGWLPYQWGVWVTAYARMKLEEGLHAIPYDAFVYADTDSIKFMGDYGSRIEELNSKYLNKKYSAVDKKGKRHYIGIFEYEEKYKQFKTLGAKKYCYVDDAECLHVTISGVGKKAGAKELKTIDNFKEGFIFKEAGGTESVYNDFPTVSEYEIEGNKVPIISNIAIYQSMYTLGLTIEYRELLNRLFNEDIRFSLHYER